MLLMSAFQWCITHVVHISDLKALILHSWKSVQCFSELFTTPPRITIFPTGTTLHWRSDEASKYSRRLLLFFASSMNDFHSDTFTLSSGWYSVGFCSSLDLSSLIIYIYKTALSKIILISSKVDKAAISSRQSLKQLVHVFLVKSKTCNRSKCIPLNESHSINFPCPDIDKTSPSYEKGFTTFSTALLILKIATFSLSTWALVSSSSWWFSSN